MAFIAKRTLVNQNDAWAEIFLFYGIIHLLRTQNLWKN